jgi:hypothetical protein
VRLVAPCSDVERRPTLDVYVVQLSMTLHQMLDFIKFSSSRRLPQRVRRRPWGDGAVRLCCFAHGRTLRLAGDRLGLLSVTISGRTLWRTT